MRSLIRLTAPLIFFFVPAGAQAGDSATDPVKLVPAKVEVVAKLNSPSALLQDLAKHEAIAGLLKLDLLSSLYDGTNFRHALQLIEYLEKNLGSNREALLESLAGHGVAFGLEVGNGKPKFIAVIGAKDQELLSKFFMIARDLTNGELERQEKKARFAQGKRADCAFWHLGNEFFVAQLGANLLATNSEKLLYDAIDIHLGSDKLSLSKRTKFEASARHRPKDALAWAWLDLEHIRAIPAVKTALEALTLNPQIQILVGGVFDIIRRSDYVCVCLTRESGSLQLRFAMPQGRQGMSKMALMFLPEDQNGSLPMLQPPRAISCTSYYFDLGKLWDQRREIFNDKQAEAFEAAEKKSAPFLGGVKLGTLLKQSGKYHRFVYADQDKSPYSIKPGTPIGAFALVLDMRDPEFAKSMNTILRGAALIGSFKLGLRMVEEKHREHMLVTYYFPEEKKLDGDVNNIRFNFSPCFTHVGDQFVISSTLELGRDLIDLLEKENRANTSAATSRTTIFAKGVAESVRKSEDTLLAQFVLSQGLSAKAARQQVRDLAELIERMGQLQFAVEYEANDFRFDIRWQTKKK